MIARGLAVHVGLLVVASALAVRTWTYDASKAPKHGETELWPGNPDQVQMVRFESKVGTMTLEPRRDSNGSYFIGVAKKNPPPKTDAQQPQGNESKPPEPAAPEEPKITKFIATKEGQELVEGIAPLRALRSLGKVTDAQKKEYGLDKEEGKIFVRTNGQERTLVFGSTTPGGTDYYARDLATGNAYVVSGSIFRDFTNADARLVEHRMHAFEDSAVKRVKITASGGSRELVRSTEKKDAWTKPSAPADKDETATNWLSKVDRLRSTSYAGETLSPPPAPADQILKIEYFDERKPIGYLELVRKPGAGPDDKTEYVAKTELTRWWATLVRSQAEQIDQDLKSILTP
ncbi:MAG TPA: DUF4340 domain-containing protein [Polyangiaceae bacterium]|nr:DUF4340 domain-containing protein [Polyangiaceae bacterium]